MDILGLSYNGEMHNFEGNKNSKNNIYCNEFNIVKSIFICLPYILRIVPLSSFLRGKKMWGVLKRIKL